MKRVTVNSIHLLLAMLCALISGCSQMFESVGAGEDVNFSGLIQSSQYLTKVTYGGDANRYTESTKTYEPIYWSVGDVIRIYCKDGSTTEIEQSGVTTAPAKYQADYRIKKVYTNKSKADIELNSASTKIGLRWNDDASKTHTFYAVYPAFLEADKQITRSYDNGINGKAIYCNLAEYQNTLTTGALSNDGSGNYTLAPDMRWMLMHGQASWKRSTFPATGTVSINFQPLTTAIQFTITNSTSSNLIIKKLQLLSSNQIAGTFNIDDVTNCGSDGFPIATNTLTVVKNQVSLEIASPFVTIAQNKTFTFTFFLSPVADVSDLQFKITCSDNSTKTTRLGYTDGTNITFPRCKKSFVKGILIPEGVQWTIDYEPVLTDWIDDDGESITLN